MFLNKIAAKKKADSSKKHKLEAAENKAPKYYTDWENDFGFLTLVANRKKDIAKEFNIKIYSKQLDNSSFISDDDINPIIDNLILDIYTTLGDNYKNFLIEKYFGTKESLIAFITEDVYIDMLTSTININNTKLKVSLQNSAMSKISKLNNNTKKEKK